MISRSLISVFLQCEMALAAAVSSAGRPPGFLLQEEKY